MKTFLFLIIFHVIFINISSKTDNIIKNNKEDNVIKIRAKRQGCGMPGGCWNSLYNGCSGNLCGMPMNSPCQSKQCQSFFSTPAFQCRPGCTTPACCRSVVPNPCSNCGQSQSQPQSQSSMTHMIQMPQMNIQIKQPPRCCPCCMPVCSKICIISGGCNSCYDYYSDMGFGKK